jgi:hypothetical protein
MKKVLAIIASATIWSCSTNDLQIEIIDFDDASVQNCGTLSIQTEVFFKLNETEALILELESDLLANEPSDGEIQSSIPGSSQLTYRIFNGNVDTGYFCDAIPPANPSVLEDVIAESGDVLITTVQDENDTTRFEHTIRLSEVSFVNSAGERLTNLNVEEYGTIVTSSN